MVSPEGPPPTTATWVVISVVDMVPHIFVRVRKVKSHNRRTSELPLHNFINREML
jgi:hypothetical protein